MNKIAILALLLAFAAISSPAQSGGPYQLIQTVVASGGNASGGTYSLVYTVGQPVAGSSFPSENYNGEFGFWTRQPFSPTAATVQISGRITTNSGQGIRNVILKLTDNAGREMTARSSAFGYYSFAGVRTGETYILTVKSRRYTFADPTRVLSVVDEIAGLDFLAVE